MRKSSYSESEIIHLLSEGGLEYLQEQACAERERWCGKEILLRAIIEFSSYCSRNCFYCGLREDNTAMPRFRMREEEIINAAVFAAGIGFKTLVLQSGEDTRYTTKDICRIVEGVKKRADCVITLSVGERSFDDYKSFWECGAERYLLKFETSDEKLFKKLKPDADYKKRIGCLEDLKNIGYQVGSGCMVGLPGQTWEILARDILLMAELGLDMIGIGPFIAHPDTPLAAALSGTVENTLRVIAVTRIVTRTAHLPATTAIATLDPAGRKKALDSGANVIMCNLTPREYRDKYAIYPNKICALEDPAAYKEYVYAIARAAGMTISWDYGHSLKKGDNVDAQIRS